MKSRVWNAYLPVADPLLGDALPQATARWLEAHEVGEHALQVLRRVREDALPLVRDLEDRDLLDSFAFFVHDRTSGVPTVAEDRSAYVHLRITFCEEVDAVEFLSKWAFVGPVEPSPGDEEKHRIIDAQAEWYFNLVEAHPGLSDLELLQVIGQHLHLFANMSQMRIG